MLLIPAGVVGMGSIKMTMMIIMIMKMMMMMMRTVLLIPAGVVANPVPGGTWDTQGLSYNNTIQ